MSNITIIDLKKIGWIPQVEDTTHTLLRYSNTDWYIDYSNTHREVFGIYEASKTIDSYNYIFIYSKKPITFVELVKLMEDNYIV